MDFFLVDGVYLLAGYEHHVHFIVDSLFGPVAFATFERNNGKDVQILGVAQFKDSEFVRMSN